MVYTVLKIEEDLDYGCEERTEDQPVRAVVTLRSPDGDERICKMPDGLLYERGSAEEDQVIFDGKGQICRPLGPDWTEYCSSENTDIPEFIGWMEEAQEGKKIERICPFCGGQVGVISNRDGRTIIGCGSCDMKIELNIK